MTVSPDSAADAFQPPIRGAADVEPVDDHEAVDQRSRADEFRDDDAGYLDWLASNPSGFVINIARNHSMAAARLHRATCRTISGTNPHNGAWTGPYVKVCAEQLYMVDEWAMNVVKTPIPSCGICQPLSLIHI